MESTSWGAYHSACPSSSISSPSYASSSVFAHRWVAAADPVRLPLYVNTPPPPFLPQLILHPLHPLPPRA
jgi:hypothetical protein